MNKILQNDSTLVDLQELLVKWQKILRLQDWKVEVKWARQKELGGPTWVGEADSNAELKIAKIMVLHPMDWGAPDMVDIDPEEVLVHELIHLHLWFIDDSNHVAEENAVECIATGLIEADRQKRQPARG